MDKHPHAAALDAIGRAIVQSHYNLKDRSWREWRKHGVPSIHHKSLALLARVKGKPVPDFDTPQLDAERRA